MNSKLKFLEIVLSDLVSNRDTLELELNRILNDENCSIMNKKMIFDDILNKIVENDSKVKMLSEYMTILNSNLNNNND